MKRTNVFFRFSLVLILVLLVAAVAIGCGEDNEISVTTDASTVSHDGHVAVGEGKYSFDFTVTFADGTSRIYDVSTDCETVGDALVTLELIDGEMGAYGLYVKSVCGAVADYDKDGTYWSLYTDGEMAMSGVDTVKCTDISTVEFKVAR